MCIQNIDELCPASELYKNVSPELKFSLCTEELYAISWLKIYPVGGRLTRPDEKGISKN